MPKIQTLWEKITILIDHAFWDQNQKPKTIEMNFVETPQLTNNSMTIKANNIKMRKYIHKS